MSGSMTVKQVVLLQSVVGIVALGVGALTGWFLGQEAYERDVAAGLGMSWQDYQQQHDELQRGYADLFERCDPLEGSERDRLIDAQERVEGLRGEIESKEAEIASLEIKARENSSLRKELKNRKRELSTLKTALQAAEQQREELVEKLKDAISEVSVAKAETRAAKRETLSVKWEEFTARALLEICEKGSRSKLEKCRETVDAAMTVDRERRYRECVRRRQAVPELRKASKDERTLPAFAEWIDQNSRFTKNDWYILFCDPTLPEAGDGSTIPATVGESDPGEALGREDIFLKGLNDE